jgi:hypothetical protein
MQTDFWYSSSLLIRFPFYNEKLALHEGSLPWSGQFNIIFQFKIWPDKIVAFGWSGLIKRVLLIWGGQFSSILSPSIFNLVSYLNLFDHMFTLHRILVNYLNLFDHMFTLHRLLVNYLNLFDHMFTLHRLPVNYLNLFDHMFTLHRLLVNYLNLFDHMFTLHRLLVNYLNLFDHMFTLHRLLVNYLNLFDHIEDTCQFF